MQPLPADRELYVEDRLAQLTDRLVELVDRFPDPHHRLRPLDQAGGALERQTDGEQALNDRVVEVPGDPVPVLGQGAVAHNAMEPGVLDGDPRCHRKGQYQLLVILGELRSRPLVGQVQNPVDLAVHLDWHAEEGGHGGMPRREPEALRALGQVGQAEWLVLCNKGAEDAPPGGAGANGQFLLMAEADGQELVEGPAVLGEDAERAVLRIHEVAGLLTDPPEHHRQVQLGVEDEDRLDQSAQLGGIVDPVEGLHGKSG